MSTTMKVAIVGASGDTGQSIVNALLSSSTPKFEITALTRPQSLNKPTNLALQSRGVRIVPADLRGPIAPLITLLQDIDIVISAIHFNALADETPLADAAKAAGVKRFVQSALMIIIPPRGVVDFREKKEENLHYIQKLRLPYTYIDAGWWHQLSLPRLPSGRVDHLLPPAAQHDGFPLGRDGNVPTALADLRDVGRYVARIIADPRTLNRRVHVYNEVYTLNRVCEVVERVSGEKLERRYVSRAEARDAVDKARMRLAHSPGDTGALLAHVAAQLFYSWGIRGDNTPENAEYLGYLSGKDLYPDFEYVSFEEYIREVHRGEVEGVYQSR
ncbi:aromatic alcohol reductase [Aspergillus brunneoviolaceus CBS 621.78]|uniref:NAD(P)-binding protein n=1 Tax=Aspergillus brunneoviolaceus CBS 621.78 TaxID=1450534 RepID=A0ACD1FYS3_9EURO|nr:NAD(P)-binding protein [Aspergillus brunneoviolaceus CBS 621.78]RAH42162.1 NAD(P)-binding protein [Aspergillus brunneoviolaceus CBS 621.78]